MFKNKFPEFQRGNILKQEMLENLRDYPRDFLKLYFNDYSNGIISGAQLVVDKQQIYITKGLIKFNQRIYFLKEVISLEYNSTNQTIIIKIKFSDFKKQNDFKLYQSNLFLDNQPRLKENELELGRFKLREGAQLRAEYEKFKDFKIEYNTINLIQVKYSAQGKYTLHPLIIKKFAQILLNRSNKVLDNFFAMQCLNSKVVSRKLIVSYLLKRLDITKKEYNNLELYNFLAEILADLSSVKEFKQQQRVKQNKIIVD